MTNPLITISSVNQIPQSPLQNNPTSQGESEELPSYLFSTDGLDPTEHYRLVREINRLDGITCSLERSEFDQLIQHTLQLNAPAALKARILIPRILLEGPSVWRRLIPVLKSNPETHQELFFWLLRSKYTSSMNAADRLEIEALIGSLAEKPASVMLEEIGFQNRIPSLREIVMYGDYFKPDMITLWMQSILSWPDGYEKASYFSSVMRFCSPNFEALKGFKGIELPSSNLFKRTMDGFKTLYDFQMKINSGKALTKQQFDNLSHRCTPLAFEFGIRLNLPTMDLVELLKLTAPIQNPLIGHQIATRINDADPTSLPSLDECESLYNPMVFLYLSGTQVEQLLPAATIKAFVENDIGGIIDHFGIVEDLITTKASSMLDPSDQTGDARFYLKKKKAAGLYLCLLELWAKTFDELTPYFKKVFAKSSLEELERFFRLIDCNLAGSNQISKLWKDLIARQLGAEAAIQFEKNCWSVVNNPQNLDLRVDSVENCRIILNSIGNLKTTLKKLDHGSLITIIERPLFFKVVQIEQRYQEIFKLFLELETQLSSEKFASLDNSIKKYISAFISHNSKGEIDDQFLGEVYLLIRLLKSSTRNEFIINMTTPGERLSRVFSMVLIDKLLSLEEIRTWLTRLLDEKNEGGDKKFWSTIFQFVKRAVYGNRKQLNSFQPFWKKFEERILKAPAKVDITDQLLNNQRQRASATPIQVAIQPAIKAQSKNHAAKRLSISTHTSGRVYTLVDFVNITTECLKHGLACFEVDSGILRFGQIGWSAIAKIANTLPEKSRMNLIKTVHIVRHYEGMNQPSGESLELLEALQQQCIYEETLDYIIRGLSTQPTRLISLLGFIPSLPYLENLYATQNQSELTEQNVRMIHARLIDTHCDERLLEDLSHIKKLIREHALPQVQDIIEFLATIIFLQDEAAAKGYMWLLNEIQGMDRQIKRVMINLIADRLSIEELFYAINETEDVMSLRFIAKAINKNYQSWDLKSHWFQLTILATALNEGLSHQVDNKVFDSLFAPYFKINSPEHDLNFFKGFCSSIIAEFTKKNLESPEHKFVILLLVLRELETMSSFDEDIAKLRRQFFETAIFTHAASRLSQISLKTLLGKMIMSRFRQRISSFSDEQKATFDLNSLSLSCLHIGEEKLLSAWGTIAILKDFGMTTEWYKKNRATVIENFNTPEYFNMIFLETDYRFPDYFPEPSANATLFDAAAEIFLKHFKGEKKLESWLKQLIQNLISNPKKVISHHRFEMLIAELDQFGWTLREMVDAAIPSPRFTALIGAACLSPKVCQASTRSQLLHCMNHFLDHGGGDLADWTSALDHFTTLRNNLKPKPVKRSGGQKGKKAPGKIDRFYEEFKLRANKFEQKIKQFTQSDSAITKEIQNTHQNVVLAICAEKELYLMHITSLIQNYDHQITECERKPDNEGEINSLLKVIEEINEKLSEAESLYTRLLGKMSETFTIAQSPPSFLDKQIKVEGWAVEIKKELDNVSKSSYQGLANIESAHQQRVQESRRIALLKKRKIELKNQYSSPKPQEAYKKAIEQYNQTLSEIEAKYIDEIDKAPLTTLEALEEIKINHEIRLAELTGNFHRMIAQIAETALPKARSISPEGSSRLKKKIAKLEESEKLLKSEIEALKETTEQQGEEIRELKYLQFSAEVIIEKQLGVKELLLHNLEMLIEMNNHSVVAAAIKKILECEGKILGKVSDLIKILDMAGYKFINQVGSHRKFGGEFGERITIANHESESTAVEVLKLLETILKTSEHWLSQGH